MNHDTISHTLSFSGNAYAYLATINHTWRRAYATCNGANTTTAVHQAVASESRVRGILLQLKLNESLNSSAFFHASKSSHLKVLNILLANKPPQALFACAHGAVAGGRVKALSWALDNGFPLDRFVCHSAASAGNLEMFVLAVNNGCSWDREQCTQVSEKNAVGRYLAKSNNTSRPRVCV